MRQKLLLVFSLIVVLSLVSFGGAAADKTNYVAHLTGDSEVPQRDTLAQGQAVFRLSDDGTSITYTLNVANINNVVASHIHIGPPGVNGSVVVFLFGAVPAGGGKTNGVLATGTFTEADFVGPLAGHSFSDLLEAIQAGNAYVNVHTNDGRDLPNSGAGDFPGGEIRGQIQ